ncbi:branched-chain alpha-ketoacid dehydrogenase [Syncephalis fuscata]|nr:branched-chain alpha-ketoacid dehydrogenase [Syncephalis fuscata]
MTNEQRQWSNLAAEAAAADSAARQHFYRNRVLERYADRPVHPVTIRQLVFFGRTLDDDKLIRSANYVRTEIPVRLAHRIRDFQRLPYIIGVNRHIATVYGLYWKAFDALRRIPPIRTLADNELFCQQVEELIQEHLIVIPQLAMGVRESRSYFLPGDADRFMNASLRSRVSRRVLAEQHLALTRQFNEEGRPAPDGRYIGLVDTRCRAGQLVARCVRTAGMLTRQEFGLPPAPMMANGFGIDIIADGHLATVFACIPDHVEYALHELLRNAMRASLRQRRCAAEANPSAAESPFPPIRVTVAEGPADLIFRVSDQGGGISSRDCARLWHFGSDGFRAFETVPELAGKVGEEAARPHVRLGIGLLMARVYAEYWGGGLDLQSMPGWGVDAHLRVSKLGNRMENLGEVMPSPDTAQPSLQHHNSSRLS